MEAVAADATAAGVKEAVAASQVAGAWRHHAVEAFAPTLRSDAASSRATPARPTLPLLLLLLQLHAHAIPLLRSACAES